MTLNSEILILFRTIEQGYQSRLSVLAKSAGLSTLEGTILSFLHCNPASKPCQKGGESWHSIDNASFSPNTLCRPPLEFAFL